ncbi:MAG: photosynthetic reaction center subunit H [Gammaproteobacteria bacterium]|jgi:photosynthetic reaction center H subunit|nr:photosynthetic reaction center subunit H [Gammaproteobacteria bacterium]
MQSNPLFEYTDTAQLALYGFWVFFAALIWYLHREDKREGYPLDTHRVDRHGNPETVEGFPGVPCAKVFRLADGSEIRVPDASRADRRPVAARQVGWDDRYGPDVGAPLDPTGNPMADGVGPAAYAERANQPERMLDGSAMIVPLRLAAGWSVDARDPDPRGMTVCGLDGAVAGTVKEIWVDRAEPQIRYLEVELNGGGRHVMLPSGFVRYDAAHRKVKVASITAAQFGAVPAIGSHEQITKLEEDRICAYYASGHLYATPARIESLI